MKKVFLIACLVSFGVLECFAQQVPLYTNYNFNLLGINPAVAGTQPCLDLRMGQRRQWTGIGGAPLSNYLLASGSFGKKRFNFHGAGIHVENDEAGRFGYESCLRIPHESEPKKHAFYGAFTWI